MSLAGRMSYLQGLKERAIFIVRSEPFAGNARGYGGTTGSHRGADA